MAQEAGKTPPAGTPTVRLRQTHTSVPFLWRLLAGLGLAAFSAGCFVLILKLLGISAPFISEQNRDTLFFAFLAAIVLFLLLIPAVRVLLRGCAEKKPAWTIVKEVFRTMTVTAVHSLVAIIVEVFLGGSRSGTGNSSSERDSSRGGGGSFGGGGASGTF
jgi:uncharacterized membrane protein YgcG